PHVPVRLPWTDRRSRRFCRPIRWCEASFRCWCSLGFLLKREDLFHGGVQGSGDPQSEVDAGRIVAALGGDDRLSGYACQLCQLCLSEPGRLANLLEVRSLHFHIAPRCQFLFTPKVKHL